jgi:hypothetical protein
MRILEQGDRESVKNRMMAYSNRCSAYRRKGDLDRAIADCTEAIRLDPEAALRSMRCASERSTELMEIISIAELRGAVAGTMIIVATRRNAANDNPSIISSSVMTS